MSDVAKVQAMRNANWTPAVTYWKERAIEAEQAMAITECRAFSAGYEAGERDALAQKESLTNGPR